MLALILWLTIGRRAATAELFVELSFFFVLYCVTRGRVLPAWPQR